MTFILLIVYILIGVAGHALWLEYQDRKLKQIISDTNKFVIPDGVTHVHIHGLGGGGGGGGGSRAEPIVAEYKMSRPTFPGQMPRDLEHESMDEPCGNCVLYGPNNCSKHFGG